MEKYTVSINIKNKKIIKQFNDYIELIYYLFKTNGIIDDQHIINILSLQSKLIPLYDIYTEQLYLVSESEFFKKILRFHYRPIDNNIYKIISNSNNKRYKLFLKNFDLHLLYKTFINNFDEYSDLTTYIRPSFSKFLYQTIPYYKRSELQTEMLIHKLELSDDDTMYSFVKQNDISYNDLVKHSNYVKSSNLEQYIKYYTFMFAYKYNNYMRFPSGTKRNLGLEHRIKKFRDLIIKAPKWDTSFYLYRFVHTDDFLKNINIGDYILDRGFISTSRYIVDYGYPHGKILIMIKIPANTYGCGVSIEYSSLFANEYEVILPPSKFKMVDNTEIVYDKIKKSKIKYVLEWDSFLDEYIDINAYDTKETLKTVNLNEISGTTLKKKITNFILEYPNYFNTKIGNDIIVFEVYRTDNIDQSLNAYKNFLYNQNCKLLLLWIDQTNNNINLIIEISDSLDVNYFFRFMSGSTKIIGKYTYDDIIIFIKKLASLFYIDSIRIHSDYKKYIDIKEQTVIYNSKIVSYKELNLYLSENRYCNQLFLDIIYNEKFSSGFMNYLHTNKQGFFLTSKIIKFFNLFLKNNLTDFLKSVMDFNIEHNPYFFIILKITESLIKSKQNATLLDLYYKLFDNYNYLVPVLNLEIRIMFNIHIDAFCYRLI